MGLRFDLNPWTMFLKDHYEVAISIRIFVQNKSKLLFFHVELGTILLVPRKAVTSSADEALDFNTHTIDYSVLFSYKHVFY